MKMKEVAIKALISVTPNGNGVKDSEKLITFIAFSDSEEKLKTYCQNHFNKSVVTKLDSFGYPTPFSWDTFYKITQGILW